MLLLLTFSCFFWHSIAHIAPFCILCTRPKSCFGGLNEQSGYLVVAEVHTARKAKTPVRRQEEESDQDDFSEGEDALY